MKHVRPATTQTLRPLLAEVRTTIDRVRYGILSAMMCAVLGSSIHHQFLDAALFPEPGLNPQKAERPSRPPRRPAVIPTELQFPLALNPIQYLDERRQPSCLSERTMVVRPGTMALARTAEDVCRRSS